jgi:hypothetical protein
MGQAEEELFHPSIKGNHYLSVVLYRLAAHHHPFAKLGMVYTVSSS